MTATLPEISTKLEGPPQAPAPTRWQTLLLAGAVAVGGGVVLAWVVAGVHSSGRGLNAWDESFYLLSYRWWDVNLRNFTGAQYLYGPVFELLGHDIAALRLFRIGTLVAVHMVFGWSLMGWLRTQRPAAAPTRLWEAAGITAVVAAGGVAAGWMPLSPGYNDAAVFGALLGMSCVLSAGRHVARGRRVPLRLAIAYGALIPAILLVKWGSIAGIAVTAVAAAAVLWHLRFREIARLAVAVLAGAGITVGALALFVPVDAAVGDIIDSNRMVVTVSKPLSATIDAYTTECLKVLTVVLDRYTLLMVAAGLVVAARWLPVLRIPAGLLAVVALYRTIREVVTHDGVHGGAGFAGTYVRTLALPLVLAFLVTLLVVVGERVHRRCRPGSALSSLSSTGPVGWIVLAALVLLPLGQAVGTTTTLMSRAIGGFAAWMAVLIVVFTGVERAAAVCRWLLASVLAATMVAAGLIAVGGLWRYPYRTFPYPTATETIAASPTLASLRFNRATAQAITAMHIGLRPYVEPPGRAMIGVPAAVLALGGRPVGEAFTSHSERIAAGIRQECRDGQPFWGDKPPVLLYLAPVTAVEVAAFRGCGIDFAAEYRMVGIYPLPFDPTLTLRVHAWVPVAEIATGAGPARRPPGR